LNINDLHVPGSQCEQSDNIIAVPIQNGLETRTLSGADVHATDADDLRVLQMLRGALQSWLDNRSTSGLRRQVLRLLLEIDDWTERSLFDRHTA
jgi:hypothetical protein